MDKDREILIKIDHIVRMVLCHEEDTRADDKLLIRHVEQYCIAHAVGIPAAETITRCRRKIQYNDGKFLPDEATLERRNKRQQIFVQYNTKKLPQNEPDQQRLIRNGIIL